MVLVLLRPPPAAEVRDKVKGLRRWRRVAEVQKEEAMHFCCRRRRRGRRRCGPHGRQNRLQQHLLRLLPASFLFSSPLFCGCPVQVLDGSSAV